MTLDIQKGADEKEKTTIKGTPTLKSNLSDTEKRELINRYEKTKQRISQAKQKLFEVEEMLMKLDKSRTVSPRMRKLYVEAEKLLQGIVKVFPTLPKVDNGETINATNDVLIQIMHQDKVSFKEMLGKNNIFADNAIDAMIKALEELGAMKKRLEAKLIGGSNMFKVFSSGENGIGEQNVKAAREKLEKEGIKIISNNTGGNVGRSVSFDLVNGLVEVKTKI